MSSTRAQIEKSAGRRAKDEIMMGRPEWSRATLQENEVIVKDPDILGGTPVFRGTRVPFQALLDYLEGGETLDEFLDDFPTVTREAAISALERATSLLVGQLG